MRAHCGTNIPMRAHFIAGRTRRGLGAHLWLGFSKLGAHETYGQESDVDKSISLKYCRATLAIDPYPNIKGSA